MRARSRLAALGAAAVLAGSLLTGCGSAGTTAQEQEAAVVHYEADYPMYASAAEVVGASDVIVRGTVLSSRVEELWPEVSTEGDPAANPQAGLGAQEAAAVQPVVVTVSTLQVTEVLKGTATVGSTIEVSQLGGQLAGRRYVDAGTTLLSKAAASEYVLLLADHGADAPLDLVNPAQGLFRVAGGTTLESVGGPEASLGLASVEGLKAEVAQQQ
ncbi:hypothetical protein [Cellulomonas cellasea]|uniref:SAF domain-containing protein n=2 Tax=Cellulomonas cellasea TaxID=43670 RepID=A0A0A0BC00_9CELL|nr:hypothetical protein [Cellulomonas cellasea]KGM03688.1 hypothetical protein Q760_15675 [Cellulomonas cellasea DSM 20118]GEA86940.1 hypothetical protein CCE01nite_08890 [Cellulomonas cellasea]